MGRPKIKGRRTALALILFCIGLTFGLIFPPCVLIVMETAILIGVGVVWLFF